ncbi:phage major capsid family protein [Acidipropionibacterium timonense]|uniref:phage major capsid family protein n=1 Tax=Acidipropionibacterium timonense TaxID=2161818 RepID=UPI0010304686|nr:phage major capsid protein [Acidipropionibacterium timonense]
MAVNATTINSTQLQLPGTVVGIVRDKALDSGTLAALSPEKPTIFGPVKGATFSGVPRAKIVGETEKKPAAAVPTITPWSAAPIKIVTQQRTSDEFMYADADYRLGVMQDLIAPALGSSIGRAVDLIAIHGIDPATGAAATSIPTSLSKSTAIVNMTASPTDDLVSAVGKIASTGESMPDGIAMTPSFNYSLATEVYPKGHSLAGQPMYPNAGFGNMGSWRGLKVGQSSTISGLPEIAKDPGIRAVMGDWSKVRWGFQRNFPIELIQYGDPDNAGRDLKGANEILLRVEAVLYVAILDPNQFVLVKDASVSA